MGCCCSSGEGGKEGERRRLLQKRVFIFTTSMTGFKKSKYDSRRLRQLLFMKGISYKDIDVSLLGEIERIPVTKILQKDAKGRLPAFYLETNYIGDYEFIQELEDNDELIDLLSL